MRQPALYDRTQPCPRATPSLATSKPRRTLCPRYVTSAKTRKKQPDLARELGCVNATFFRASGAVRAGALLDLAPT